jgi:integration host factor subunit alpha
MGLSKADAAESVEAIFDAIKETLSAGEKVQIVRFGSFHILKKKERIGRNPKTGDEIMISPRKVLTFKSSQILRDIINNSMPGK